VSISLRESEREREREVERERERERVTERERDSSRHSLSLKPLLALPRHISASLRTYKTHALTEAVGDLLLARI
jgi:hypothetical protein